MKNAGHLSRFIRDMCANYDPRSGPCHRCKVLTEDTPCGYFEKSVLGPPDYPYKVPGYDYRKLFDQYGRINPALAGRGVVVRRCECGATLQPKERVCEKCRTQHRRATYREAQKKRRRNGRVSTVTEISPKNSAA